MLGEPIVSSIFDGQPESEIQCSVPCKSTKETKILETKKYILI